MFQEQNATSCKHLDVCFYNQIVARSARDLVRCSNTCTIRPWSSAQMVGEDGGGANSLTSYEPRVYHVSYFKSCVLEHVRASLSEVSLETSRQVDKMV